MNAVPTLELRSSDITDITEASFWSLVKLNLADPSGCWIWTGHKGGQYGRFKVNGSRYSANRVAYAIAYGIVPAGKFVCHRCDNPACVRPDHLFLGTAGDNAKDKIAKNRHCKGSKVGSALLNEDKVARILRDDRTHRSIAIDYGVAKSTIGKIKTGVNWRHVWRSA